MECKQKDILKNCTCTYTSCSRRGKCCECVMYHRKNGEIPGCFFPPEAEKSYDRSVENFIRSVSLRN
ncbi:MAG TPA: DUF6485 family protein [bacterium]|nr:hypothetical protein [Myxococcales bacterium]OQA61810.1 MAG: hypothetical protein BWY40_00429 [bacterium ADurb.Bin270]HPW45056.1 DUF6485 family protein [bacterium]HQC50809.1 DUF6485 family protein [bacterium]HQG14139.1 DUF6485 family protein [bacterium]